MSYYCEHNEEPWSNTKLAIVLSVAIIAIVGIVLIIVFGATSSSQEAEAEEPGPPVSHGSQRAQECQFFCQEVEAEGIYHTACNVDIFQNCQYGHCTCIPDSLIEKLRGLDLSETLPAEKPETGPN